MMGESMESKTMSSTTTAAQALADYTTQRAQKVAQQPGGGSGRSKRKKGGRGRKDGARTPSGQLSRAQMEDRAALSAATPETVAQRAALVGNDNARDARAGDPLGILLLAGMITPRQHAAGESMGITWRKWCREMGFRRPHPLVSGAGHALDVPDMEADAWDRLRAKDAALRSIVAQQPARRLMETVLWSLMVELTLPPRLDPRRERWGQGIEALGRALDQVADYLGIPPIIAVSEGMLIKVNNT